jgi:4-amino-4-deoxy-L-arabinose transferase-like glycosyltransferase
MIPTSRYTRALALLLLLDAALLLPVLGRSTLSRIDETQIAEVSREMATGHDWVTPRIGTLPFAAYPPLQYWILAATGSVFGFNEFAMRLPTALFALGLLWLVARMTRRAAGDEAALGSAMILATVPTFFIQSMVCRADVITMFFATAALDAFLAWVEVPEKGGRKNRDLAIMYLCTALGLLAKGPLTVAVLGLGGLAWFLLHREWKLLLAMKFWIGIPAVLLIVAPWYYAVYRINGWAFLHENLFLENLNAFGEGYQQKRPWTFYLRQTPLFLPWLLAIPLAWPVRRAPGVAFSLLWFAFVCLFFQLSSAKRLNYLTYAAPPLAMAAGTILTALWKEHPKLLRNALVGLASLIFVAGLGLVFVPTEKWTGSGISKIATQLPLIGGLAGAAALAVAGVTLRLGPCAGFGAMTVTLAAAFCVYGAVVNPRLNPEYRELADYCRRVAAKVPSGETLYVPAEGGAEGFYHFYVGRPLPPRNGEPGLYFASEPQQEQFRKAGKRIDLLDSMLDQRGHGRYLLRINP